MQTRFARRVQYSSSKFWAAVKETEEALARWGLELDEVKRFYERVPVLGHPLFKIPHVHGSTGADAIELAGRFLRPLEALKRAWAERKAPPA